MAARNESVGGSSDPIVIVVSRRFDAPAERVFDAWLDPSAVGQWLFATPGGKMVRVEIDPRVGGEFQVFEQRGEMVAEHYGRYVEIDRPRRIVFLFAVTKFTEPNEDVSRVTIDVTPAGSGCEVTLTHEIDPRWAEYVDRTRGGWTKILEKLHNMLESTSTAAHAEPLVVERVFDAPVSLVWHAITDEQAIKQWFFEFEEFQPRVGFEFQFTGEDKGIKFLHHCRVTEVVPEKKLAYSWRYDGYSGDSLVTFELFPEGNKTKVRLTHAGLDTFPKVPSFAKENFVAGWNALIGELLKNFVESKRADSVADRQVVTSRVFDVPRERLFEAFRDPAQLAQWWGPNGFTNTIQKFDFRPDGEWAITMHGPDGVDYPNESVFTEVTEPERIVFIHLRPMHQFEMAMDFADAGGGARLTWHMTFDTVQEYERVKQFVIPANEQNFDRLAAHLRKMG
jgi:uncharacterized protein YndB with AHSA1/START domain